MQNIICFVKIVKKNVIFPNDRKKGDENNGFLPQFRDCLRQILQIL